MIVKLLTEHHLEFLSSIGGCRGSSESAHVKTPHCWKSHAKAHIILWLNVTVMVLLWCGQVYPHIIKLASSQNCSSLSTQSAGYGGHSIFEKPQRNAVAA